MSLHVRHSKKDTQTLRFALSITYTIAIFVAVLCLLPAPRPVAATSKTPHSLQTVTNDITEQAADMAPVYPVNHLPPPDMTFFLGLNISASPQEPKMVSIQPINVSPLETEPLPMAELIPAPDELPRELPAEKAHISPQAQHQPPKEQPFTPAQYLSAPQPEYPQRLQRRRISGSVKVRIYINEYGKPTGVEVLSSPHPALSESTRQTILTSWHFIAARKGKTTIKSTVITAVIFQL